MIFFLRAQTAYSKKEQIAVLKRAICSCVKGTLSRDILPLFSSTNSIYILYCMSLIKTEGITNVAIFVKSYESDSLSLLFLSRSIGISCSWFFFVKSDESKLLSSLFLSRVMRAICFLCSFFQDRRKQ